MRYQRPTGKTHLCRSAGAEMKLLGGWVAYGNAGYRKRAHASTCTSAPIISSRNASSGVHGPSNILQWLERVSEMSKKNMQRFAWLCLRAFFRDADLQLAPNSPKAHDAHLRKLRTTEIHRASIKQINCLCVLARAK